MSDQKPIPMRLVCEGCGKLHIDEGEFATKVHHTHSCQFCGLTWRPAVAPTVGVRDETKGSQVTTHTRCRNPSRPSICMCPLEGRGYGPRQVLAQPFINSWLGAGLTSAANALAADETVSEERLWRMLFTLEDEASGSMELWRACQ